MVCIVFSLYDINNYFQFSRFLRVIQIIPGKIYSVMSLFIRILLCLSLLTIRLPGFDTIRFALTILKNKH